ncbi:putative vacuolar amino acid transporter YPQ1 [Cyberlindnera fabianii]|uniref:Putative vacuolar amino acid transporter YPQ1 n=1 Tax=Cyberlindnera fabianii TaxID=36022 RepID=A0A1V2L764_CYBFA|nr:putative vacuolar amino acid transporter YPQ1 [Cyberlindnera fabianii]
MSDIVPSQHFAHVVLDNKAISGVTGSISISFWIIVFMPQIYENYVRKSSEGLSLLFVILWLAGDVFNVLGAVMQHVLPTMIILAIYYTAADVILLWQCLTYGDGSEVDPVHLSPANPLSENIFGEMRHDVLGEEESGYTSISSTSDPEGNTKKHRKSRTQNLVESSLIILVILSGIIGWYLSYDPESEDTGPDLEWDSTAQFFGWLSAVLYLGSRMPQILLNYRRKSCEGISFLFFLCACLGNLTYVISILSISINPSYLAVQSSWLAGSIGTLALDFTIFIQFFLYNKNGDDDSFDEISD